MLHFIVMLSLDIQNQKSIGILAGQIHLKKLTPSMMQGLHIQLMTPGLLLELRHRTKANIGA